MDMNNKNIIINHLDEYDLQIFNLYDLALALDLSTDKVRIALGRLVDEGIIVRLQRALYAKPSFSDQYVLAYQLCKNGAIAYWSALSYHGLTTQFSNTIFIQSPRRIFPKVILGTSFKFVQVDKKKIGQFQKVGRGNNIYYVTTIEKTIVDCFDHFDYSGGWTELVKSFYKAKLNSKLFIEACELVHNISVIKRLGYLAFVSQKAGMKNFIKYVKSNLNDTYDILDNESAPAGNFNTEWMLDLNVSDEELRKSLVNIY